jgi:lysophospholipid acyltransferase (LPLAT)-like uncharacterized protein
MGGFKRFLNGAGGLLGSALVRGWMGSLEFKAAHYDPAADMASPDRTGPKIFVLWHEYLLFPLYLRGNCHTTLLMSLHRDADILSRVAYHMGFDMVRGSSGRGGLTALRGLLDSKNMNFAITPDGPRGPRRTLAVGPVYLASKLGMPLVVSAIAYDRPWRLNTWDRFAIPRPGSRARAITGPAISVPPDLDRAGLERYRVGTERLLNRLTAEAEAWAESDSAMADEMAVRREPAPPANISFRPAAAQQRKAA